MSWTTAVSTPAVVLIKASRASSAATAGTSSLSPTRIPTSASLTPPAPGQAVAQLVVPLGDPVQVELGQPELLLVLRPAARAPNATWRRSAGSFRPARTSARPGAVKATPLEVGTKFRWIRLTGGGLGDAEVIGAYRRGARILFAWATNLDILRQWWAGGPGGRIVVGEVKATTLDHDPLRAAVAGCTNAAADRGQGVVATWPARWPRWFEVQIDNVFTDSGLRTGGLRVLDLPGSDHPALLTHIVLPPLVVAAPARRLLPR